MPYTIYLELEKPSPDPDDRDISVIEKPGGKYYRENPKVNSII